MALQEKIVETFNKEIATTLQKVCFEQFNKEGFPNKKQEDWKYTSVNSLVKLDYTVLPHNTGNTAELSQKDISKYTTKNLNADRIVFLDGIWQEELSVITENSGLEVTSINNALSDKKHSVEIEKYYNKILTETSLTALNTALSQTGVYIHVSKNTHIEKPIEILYLSSKSQYVEEEGKFTQARNLIIVEDNAFIQLIEKSYNLSTLKGFNNHVTEGVVGQNARLNIYKIQNDTNNTSSIDHTHIRQQRDSIASVQTFSFSGKIVRNNLNFYQEGSNIDSILNGLTLIKGNTHVDHNTFVHHTQPNSESHQDYKGIFSEKAVGVFNGKIKVEQLAQKTNAFQSSNNLLLSDTAKTNSKPQLEIFADDVKCSHGCTIGQLDKQALFYLQSRGIPLKDARTFLVHAFANDVLESIDIPELKEELAQTISKQLEI